MPVIRKKKAAPPLNTLFWAKCYSLFDSFDENDNACTFNEDEYKAAHKEMVEIIKKIIQKLEEINNNDFVIEDYITKDIVD